MKYKQYSQLFSLLIIFSIVFPLTSTAANGRVLTWIRKEDDGIESRQLFYLNQQVTASITSIVNLPIVEQHAPTATPIPPSDSSPPESVTEVNTGTPPPTPIPVQTGHVNIPIVFGALGIMLVIILAWFIVGYLPARGKN